MAMLSLVFTFRNSNASYRVSPPAFVGSWQVYSGPPWMSVLRAVVGGDVWVVTGECGAERELCVFEWLDVCPSRSRSAH